MITTKYLNDIIDRIRLSVKGIVDYSCDTYVANYYIKIRKDNFFFKMEISDLIEETHYRMERSLRDKFDSRTVVETVASHILDCYKTQIMDTYFK